MKENTKQMVTIIKDCDTCDTCGHAYPDQGVSYCSWIDGCYNFMNIKRGWTPRTKTMDETTKL